MYLYMYRLSPKDTPKTSNAVLRGRSEGAQTRSDERRPLTEYTVHTVLHLKNNFTMYMCFF